MTDSLIQIVDENDMPLRGGTKQEVQQQGLWHRIAKMLLRDSEGNVLLQRRGEHVLSPGRWDFSAAGHVDEDEDYIDAAQRELHEELGVTGISLREVDRTRYEKIDENGLIFRRFAVTFTGTINHDYTFHLDPEEVAEIRWLTVEALTDLVRSAPESVTSGLKQLVESGAIV